MTFMENLYTIIMIALVIFGALTVLAYYLGKKEGYDQAMDELERKQIKRGLASYPTNRSRRRRW